MLHHAEAARGVCGARKQHVCRSAQPEFQQPAREFLHGQLSSARYNVYHYVYHRYYYNAYIQLGAEEEQSVYGSEPQEHNALEEYPVRNGRADRACVPPAVDELREHHNDCGYGAVEHHHEVEHTCIVVNAIDVQHERERPCRERHAGVCHVTRTGLHEGVP